jgi:hypothetical protein
MQWLKQKQWINKYTLVVSVALIALSFLAIFSNLVGRSFTADDVAQQTLAHALTQDAPYKLITNNDTFILKIPIYLLVAVFIHAGRGQLILESLLFNGLMIGLFFLWFRELIPDGASKWLVFGWLVAAGTFWTSQTVNPNTRNIELGLMVLFALFTIKNVEEPPATKKSIVLYLLGGATIAGILTYNDPYFLYYDSLSLVIALTIYCRRQKRYHAVAAVAGMLLLSEFIYKLLGIFFTHHNLTISASSGVSILSQSYISFHGILPRMKQEGGYYLSFFGAGTLGVGSNPWHIIRAVIDSSVICLAIGGLYCVIAKSKDTLLNTWMVTILIITITYVGVNGYDILFTYRYLTILIPLTAVFVAIAVQRLSRGKKRYYYAALVLIGASLLCNSIQAISTVYLSGSAPRPNEVNYQIITTLNHNDVTKAYGDYWIANTTYYLSDYKNNVLPTQCINSSIYVRPFLVNNDRYQAQSTKVAIIVDPSLVIPTRSPYFVSWGCTTKSAILEFGEPEKIVSANAAVDILIYNHDPLE